MSAASSTGIDNLQLTTAEILLLRQHEDYITQVNNQAQQRNMTESTRGRGTSRQGSTHTSRNASVTSSRSLDQRLHLNDSGTLARLTAALDNIIRSVQQRGVQLTTAAQAAADAQNRGIHASMADADRELKKLKKLINEIGEAEKQCDELIALQKKIARHKERVDRAAARYDKLPSSNSSRHTVRR